MTEREKHISDFREAWKNFETKYYKIKKGEEKGSYIKEQKEMREAIDKYNAAVQKDFNKLKESLKNSSLFVLTDEI